MLDFRFPYVLLAIPFLAVWFYYVSKGASSPGLVVFSTQPFSTLPVGWRVLWVGLTRAIKLLALVAFLIALAGPRGILSETPVASEGVSIVLALDASLSMAAEDFTIDSQRVNRLAAIKKVVAEFIDARKGDRIGLVVFSGRAYSAGALTVDRQWVLQNLERIELGQIEDGTAIGSAIAASVSRLKTAKDKSRVIILLTDGNNNAGKISPSSAAELARALGIKIYVIGAGTRDLAPYPVTDVFGRRGYQNVRVEIDEPLMRRIAEITGGSYFRATDTDSLRQIYAQIDRLEKVRYEQTVYREYREYFSCFVLGAWFLIFLEILLSRTVFLRVP